MLKLWSYLINTFEVNTRKAPTKMLRIANDHDSRLNGASSDSDILGLWTVFNVIVLVFHTLYAVWKNSISYRMSRTLNLTNKFKLLSDEWIKDWEGKVHNFYREGNPEALAIFPNKRGPFQTGTYDERIIAVKTLSLSMAPYASLDIVKADVEDKYDVLVKARDEQKQAMQNASNASINLEKQRNVVTQHMYKNLGTLMAKHFMNPPEVEQYFNLSLIRRSSTESDGMFNQGSVVNPGSSLTITVPKKFDISINASFLIANIEGGSELHFFFSDSADKADSPQKAVVLPGESVEATAGEIGWSATNHILIVKNVGTLTSEYEMTATEAVV